MTDKQLDAFERELAAGYRPGMPFNHEPADQPTGEVVFRLRVPILSVMPALIVTLVLAALVWAVTSPAAFASVLSADICPSEDSCTADYRDDGWHIEPATP